MNNYVKAAIALGAAGCLYWLYRHTKSSMGKFEAHDEEVRNHLKEQGYTEEQISKGEVTPVPNLPEEAFREIVNESIIDDDSLLVDNIICKDGKTQENVVHIKQRYDDRLRRDVVEVLFEIPVSALSKETRCKSDGSTTVLDFIESIRGIYDRETETVVSSGFTGTMEEIVRKHTGPMDTCVIGSRVAGYVFGEYDIDGETRSCMFSVPKAVFYPTYERVTDFIKAARLEPGKKAIETDSGQTINIIDAIAVVQVMFPVQDLYNPGINKKSLIEIVKTIYDEPLGVTGATGTFEYDKFLFYDSSDQSGTSVFDIVSTEGKLKIVTTKTA